MHIRLFEACARWAQGLPGTKTGGYEDFRRHVSLQANRLQSCIFDLSGRLSFRLKSLKKKNSYEQPPLHCPALICVHLRFKPSMDEFFPEEAN